MTSPEEELRALGVSASVSAAYDLLTDAGVPAERAATLAVNAERAGQDAETFARHYLRLRAVVIKPTSTTQPEGTA